MIVNADNSDTWRGSTHKELFNGRDRFSSTNQVPDVTENDTHTVLFNLPLPEDETEYPLPRAGEDRWEADYVKLPSSPSSKYFEIDEDGNRHEKLRWDLIKSSLLASEIRNAKDLEAAIKLYSSKSVQETEFTLLQDLFEEEFSDEDSEFFFNEVVPEIIKLAFRLPELISSPIPFLQKKMNHSISLSQEQAGCLLANAFLCTFPNRSMKRKCTDYPEINFTRLYCSTGQHVTEKLKCILNYFKRICCQEMPRGVLTFQRRFIEPENFPLWSDSDVKFSSIKFSMTSDQTIEEGSGMLQVDFANSYLGGGVLGWGCVQEEIRFVINPEMIVGMLFCESMRTDEAIFMTGCEQFNRYEGYSKSFKWCGSFRDETSCDSFRRKKTYVVAIDALSFHKPHQQFQEFALKRELNKAFVGYFHDPSDETPPIPVCSGNWGCGAFRGFKPLKALIQLMACCANRRNLLYCTFGEKDLIDEVYSMFEFLTQNDLSVGKVWSYLKAFQENNLTDQPDQLYRFIYHEHKRRTECNEVLDGVTFDDDEEMICPPKKVRIDDETNELRNESSENSIVKSDESTNIELRSDDLADEKKTVMEETEILEKPELSNESSLSDKTVEQVPVSSKPLKDSPPKVQKTKITDFFKKA